MKKILSITFFDAFISGALILVIPLLLLERNVELVEIGLTMSILHIVFIVVRLLIALMADLRGWNRFFLLIHWPSSLLTTFTYFIAGSTSLFLLGKVFEAIKESSYWAINRTAIFSSSPKREEKESTKNMAVFFLSNAIGSAVAGLGIAYLGFSITLSILIVAAGIMGVPAALLWKTRKLELKPKNTKTKKLINPKNYGKSFWLVSLILMLFTLSDYPLIYLLLPVFMTQQLEYSYTTIGIVYMMYNVIASAAGFGALKFSLGIKRSILQSGIVIFTSFLLVYSNFYFLGFLMALALAHGLGWGFIESIIAKVTKGKPSVSVDIGLLIVPTRLAQFASLLYVGFIAQSIGYAPIFVSTGILFSVFSVLALYFLRKESS